MDYLGYIIVAALGIGIWFSYRLFMKGDTAKDRIAKLMPQAFKPDMFHQKGDTYVGYESASNCLVLIDWPHSRVLSPGDIRELQPVSETMMGVTHHWLEVDVPSNPTGSRFRIWFQFRRAPRDVWADRLSALRSKRPKESPPAAPPEPSSLRMMSR